MWFKKSLATYEYIAEPFDQTDFSGPIAGVVALLAILTGLSREQAENIWGIMAKDAAGGDTIQDFGYACLRLNYAPKFPDGWLEGFRWIGTEDSNV